MTSKNNIYSNKLNELTARFQRDRGSFGTRLRIVATLLLMLCVNMAWGQVITPTTETSNPIYYLFQSFGNTGFYMRPNGTNVNTSNILTDDMKWYFLDSDESGYYYICDKDGNYLYFSKPSGSTSSRTWMELKNSLDNNDTEHYKFSIAKNNTKKWDAYNIIPYGNDDKYCLNKQGRNAGTNGIQVTNGWDDENSNWIFIPMTTYEWTLRSDCFRPSDSSNKYFYQIKSKKDASYYIKPGTNYVETSNTVDDDMIWYFEEASSDDYMTYYYIRLANDGQYLKYRDNGDNAIQLANHTGSETGDEEDRFQFIVVRGAVSNEAWNTKDISYNIVPKLLKRTNNNINFFCVSSNKGLGKPLKTLNDRASTDNKWTFVSVDFPTICAKPTITFSNTTGKASITTTTTRSTIYYTTDGSVPSSSNGEVYTAPFEVTEQTTIKAFVTRTGFSDSQVTTKTIYKVATPSIQNTEASVISITTATSGATIYYTTDGSTPTTLSTEYTEPVTITASSVTIKAIAVKDGMINSAVSSESYAFACATPTISFDNTTNTVTIVSETGSTIYYAYGSTDPADPTVDNGVAHGSSPVTFTISAKTYIKALAIKEGLANSAVQSVMIDKVSAPVIDVTGDNKVKLTSSTPGVTIYYEIGDDASSVTTPTTSSTRYTSPLSNVTGKVIKAIAVKDGWITSDIGGSEGPITLKCAMPVIRRGIGNTFTISCGFPVEGVHIYYTTGNGDPTTLYEGPVSIATYPVTVKAIAKADGYNDSSLAEETITQDLVLDDGYYLIASAGDFEKFVTMANSTGAGDKYKVVDNFTVSGNTAVSTTFTGTFEGGFDDESGEYFTITGLRQPLFNSTNNAIIKNVILDNVSISSDADAVGAIVCVAKGYTRIYNCGILPNSALFPEGTHPSVSTTGMYAGGIVGSLEDDSRVVNCFSYADVSATTAAGIVGNNTFASTAKETNSKYTELRTMVVNCMFYGNISSTNIYPVYGGAKITNKGATAINNYNYYRNGSTFTGTLSDYNCSWPVKEEFLTHYEYYRYLLNSNRELCGWWVGAPSAPSTMAATAVQNVPKDASLMAKWVLDQSIAPYPILKQADFYTSVINPSPTKRVDSTTRQWVNRVALTRDDLTADGEPKTEGQTFGTLKVYIDGGDNHSGSTSMDIPITAMDLSNEDYCYGKIKLPYYSEVFGNPNSEDWNEKYADNYTAMVVTGWDITDVSGGTPGTLVEDWQDGYNFADRKCTVKDKNRVFAQGGYYYVPDGVESITITAHWATAIYMDNIDHSYDRVYFSDGAPSRYGAKEGIHFAPAGYRTAPGDLTVNNGTISSNIPTGSNVYDKAIVLVGNHQYRASNTNIGTGSKACTIMSADFDCDGEPDYCLEWQLGQKTDRYNICPIRFDFLPVIKLGMAIKEDDSKQQFSMGCYRPLGHFEVTETSLLHFGQFEFGNVSRTIDAPLILNGGIYDQYCKGTKAHTDADDHIDYIIIGGNVYIPSFTPGAHVNTGAKYPTRHCAVNVIGGKIDYLYLTGNFNEGITPNVDNPHCYIDGGSFKQVAAAGKEGIKGDVTFVINHSIIGEFYGGSTLSNQLVTGDINVTIDNSKVTKYCGGPMFGDMTIDKVNPSNGKTVKTQATGTTFGVYYGGGNGGTSYVQYDSRDNTTKATGYNWTGTGTNQGAVNNYTPGKYRNRATGYQADYEMEIVNTSAGTSPDSAVFRTYFYAAQFSATNTGPIQNTLKKCKVLTNFYGGGNLGGVIGDVTSTLEDTEVLGSAFGAGFSAQIPQVTIHNRDKEYPTVNIKTSIITPSPEESGTSTTYTWTNKTSLGGQTLSTSNPAVENVDGINYFYTEEPLVNLGTVTGEVTLNINGSTTVGGNVYGGGEESGVGGSTLVFINNTGAAGTGNVFGAGKGLETDYGAALVKGTSTVTMSNGIVKGNIYGGGELSSVGTFTRADEAYHTTHPTVEVGTVLNYTSGGTTTVTISGGTVGNESEYTYNAESRLRHTNGGNVFAGCKGVLTKSDGSYLTDWIKFARVKNTVLNVSGENTRIMSNIYGGGEIGSVGYLDASGALVEGCDASVTVSSGIIGTEIKNNNATEYTFGSVFGGGYGSNLETTIPGQTDPNAPKLFAGRIYGNTTVTMTDGAVKASVYGGGEMASVSGNAEVEVSGGTIGIPKVGNKQFGGATMGNVYGGGSGDKNIVRAGQIYGNTNVSISQAENKTTRIYHNIYGGGAYGSVGTYTYTSTTEDPNYPGIEKVTGLSSCTSGGTATITITGGTIGADGKENGMVFGSSRGDVGVPGTRDDLVAWVNTTNVTVGAANTTGPTIRGSVYGSGENGHTLSDAVVTVHSGIIGIHDGTTADATRGNVYGAGCGTDKYYEDPTGVADPYDGNGDSYNPKAGIVQGTTKVTINGGHVLHNVYGAGAMGPVGKDGEGHNTTVIINGGRIGYDGNDNGYVFGGARGDQGIGRNFAYVGDTEVNINYTTTPDTDNNEKTEQLIAGSVFGGGEAGSVHGSVVVKMNKGLVLNDVYGGGALADTNTDNWGTTTWADATAKSTQYTTTVNLKGGKINRNVYGGGLGQTADAASGLDDIEAKVYGNVLAELNNGVADDAKGCVVLGSIFGCNNLNGTPMGDVKVHINKTQNVDASKIAGTDDGADEDHQPKVNGRYDLIAVYGGGNQSAYVPADLENNKTEVVIDGCDLTSIKQVYGGGNAACTPATNVTINGTFEILELFGGGNGLDNILINGVEMPNPGANVGYKNYSVYYQDDGVWKVKDADDADTKAKRLSSGYVYGTGKASVNLYGGTVHRVFGGSNTKGNVRLSAVTLLDENGGCDFYVDEAYGGGKSAEMDAEAQLLMACIPGLEAVYGGAEAADVRGNVTLNITNGTFDRVFGGNNVSGTIGGAITINVEEIGCRPVKIGELYGGGNQAAYSVYGYDSNGKAIESGTTPLYDDPQVNVMSFTSIGNIYGGGFGDGATMVGNPTVNVNVAYGRYYDDDSSIVPENTKIRDTYPIPSHAIGKMGAISNVFGGGNAAKVIGNTNVNIATLEEVYVVKQVTVGTTLPDGCYTRKNDGTYDAATGTAVDGTTYYEKKEVQGVDIRGNVYGGGNNAEVTGDAKVKIGKRNEGN